MNAELKIYYDKRQNRKNLFAALVFFSIAVASYIFMRNFILMGFVGLGIAYFATYLIRQNLPYLHIKRNYLLVNGFAPIKIKWNEIIDITLFAADYTVKYHTRELVIHTELIDRDSQIKLHNLFDSLQIPNSKKDFSR